MVVYALNEQFCSIGIKMTAVLGELKPVGDSIGNHCGPDGRSFSLRPVEPCEIYEAVKFARTDLGNSIEDVPSRLFSDFWSVSHTL